MATQLIFRPIVEEHYTRFNDRSFRKHAQRYVSPRVVIFNTATGERLHGVEGYCRLAEGWIAALPDAHIAVIDQRTRDNIVFTTFWLLGTFDGHFSTPYGMVKGNGQQVSLECHEEVEVVHGRIARIRLAYNLEEMLHQLGAG